MRGLFRGRISGWLVGLALLVGCSGGKGSDDSAGGGKNAYTLCDGSEAMRLGVVSEGGQVDTTYQLTNPYGHSFLFVDGHCRYFASVAWLKGVVVGELSRERARQLEKTLTLKPIDQLDYHDVMSCPDAGVSWLRTASGYVDCTCACDASAPAGVEAALNAAGMLKYELAAAGDPLEGSILLAAMVEEGAVSNRTPQSWPLIWPLSDIGVTWEAYTRKPDANLRELTGDEAIAAHLLRAQSLKSDPSVGSIRVSDQGKVYALFMREQLPDTAERAIERLLAH